MGYVKDKYTVPETPCSNEMHDLSLVEAMQRILNLALKKIRSTGIVTEDVVLALVDSIMNIAIDMLQTEQRLSPHNNVITVN